MAMACYVSGISACGFAHLPLPSTITTWHPPFQRFPANDKLAATAGPHDIPSPSARISDPNGDVVPGMQPVHLSIRKGEARMPQETTGVVTATVLNVRPEPNTTKPPIGQLVRGTNVAIITRS